MRHLSLTVSFLLVLEPAAAAAPNVLLFLSDDTNFLDFGCYGNKDVRTPHIDALAKQSMRFDACYNSSPMCAPTRMSLYTGIHPVRNGAWPNHSQVYDHVRSLPHFLQPLRYRVGIIGKRHEAPKANFPFEFLGGRHHDNGEDVDLDLGKVKRFLQETKDQPFCLVVSSNQAHTPWNRGDATVFDPASFKVPPYLVDTPETRKALAQYYAEISYFDNQLGTCLRYLSETGKEKNTIVIFLSEQGSQFPFCKWSCYETGLRSACLIRWPGVVKPGSATTALTQYVDLVPTLLEAAGSKIKASQFDGKSLLPLLRGESNTHHEFVPGLQTSATTGVTRIPFAIRTIRDSRYRLIWNLHHDTLYQNRGQDRTEWMESWRNEAKDGDAHAVARLSLNYQRPEFELYDLQEDPWALMNLANNPDHQKTRKRLYSALAQWMKEQGDQGIQTELATPKRRADFRWPSKP